MRNGEMAMDRWGKWHWPIDTIAVAFRQSYAANYLDLTHCPFCGDPLPVVSDAHKPPWEPPPPGDTSTASGGEGSEE